VIRWLPELLFNDAHRLAQAGDDNGALVLLTRANSLRSNFAEAQILMTFIEGRRAVVEAMPPACESASFSEIPESLTEPIAVADLADHAFGENAAGATKQEVIGSQVSPESES
jgi:hypothetical protein